MQGSCNSIRRVRIKGRGHWIDSEPLAAGGLSTGADACVLAEDTNVRDVDTDKARMGESPELTARYRIPVPWLGPHEQVGLGSAVKKLTKSAGIEECEPCSARAAALNRLVALSGRSSSANSLLNRLLPLMSFVAVFMLVRGTYQRLRR